MTKNLISASILSADFSCLEDQICQAEAGGVDWIHIDVMDGSFVPNISMGPFIVETVRSITKLPLDVHLMIDYPERHIEAFANAGADLLTVHIENTPHIFRLLQHIQSLGCKAGIALNPGTPTRSIDAILPILDLILIMTVNPGYSGQKFISQAAEKIKVIKESIQDLDHDLDIEVDGGVNDQVAPRLKSYGANVFVAATAIFKHPAGIAAGVQALRQSIQD